jgi:hypothetical protein
MDFGKSDPVVGGYFGRPAIGEPLASSFPGTPRRVVQSKIGCDSSFIATSGTTFKW